MKTWDREAELLMLCTQRDKGKLSLTSPNVLPVVSEMIRSATPFPLVSLFFMFIGFVLSNIGHIRPHHTILAFVSGIFFILSGTGFVVKTFVCVYFGHREICVSVFVICGLQQVCLWSSGWFCTSPTLTMKCWTGPKRMKLTSATSTAGLLPLPPSPSCSLR